MYETLEKREKTGLDRDPNNPNASSLASSQTSTTSTFSKSVGPSAARTSLKEKIAEQRRAKLAASKGVADRPSSAAASYETSRSLSSKSLGAGARTMSNTSTTSNGPARPPSAMSGESTKSALKSSTGTGSLMSGTVRRPIRRPELNRPKTADPYASRQSKLSTSTTTTPEKTPAVKSLKKSVGPTSSSVARSRTQTQNSPAVSPPRSKSRVDTGRTTTHRKAPSIGSQRGSPAVSPHKDEDLTMVKPFIRSQSHHDGTVPFRQRNGMDKRASIESNALDMDEDNFTMVVPNLARPISQRVQSTPPKPSPPGGHLPVPSPRAAAVLSPSLLPAQSPRQKSPDRNVPEEVEVYEDPFSGDEPSIAGQEVDTPVLGELPINERSNERQPSIDSNGDSLMMGDGTGEQHRGHHKTTSTGSVMHLENSDANSPETLKNRQLLASALKKIEGRTVDAGMFRKIQDAIKSGQEIWGPNDEVFGRLLVACLDYFQTPTEELKLPPVKAGSCKSQALATIRAMLSLYRKETAKYFSRVLCTILQAKAQHENTSHIAGDMEATANEIVRYGQVSDCLSAVLALIEDMPASTPTSSPNSKSLSPGTPASNSTRTMTMSLRTLASLVEISGSKNVVLTPEQTHRLGKLAVRCMEDQDPGIRKANIDFCVALHERIVGPSGETKAFWEAVAGAGDQQLNLLTYYLAKKQKA